MDAQGERRRAERLGLRARQLCNYPDIDDTAVALIVLARLPRSVLDQPRIRATVDRALAWTLAMQSSNGGWAAFDKDNDWLIITKIPFCDFGEALDPPSADVTAHVLEALGLLGFDRHHKAVARGYEFLRKEQETDGSWFGRWGVNHIYGTAAVLPGAGDDRRGHVAGLHSPRERLARRASEHRRRLGRDLRVVYGR